MPARVVWNNMAELRSGLLTLPADLTADATPIVKSAGARARSAIVGAYPFVSGRLKAGVTVTYDNAGPFGISARVTSAARHSHLYEFGTRNRRTRRGYNRGVMPAKPAFVPRMQATRAAMYPELIAMMESHGLTVTGNV